MKTQQEAGAASGFSLNRDMVFGAIFLLLAIGVFAMSAEFAGMGGASLGPATLPRILAVLLGAGGVAIMAMSRKGGGAGERIFLVGPLVIAGSVIGFGLLLKPLGMFVSAFLLVAVASLAGREAKPLQSLLWAAILAAFATLLFVKALGVAVPVWPRV